MQCSLRSHRCPQHSDEQRQNVRLRLLGTKYVCNDMLFFSTLASLLKSRNAVMRNDVFTDVLKLYLNKGKIIDHRAKYIAPLSLRVGQRYKHFGMSPWAAWAGERSLVPDPRQTSPRLVLNLPARGETRVLRVAKFCSIKLLYGDLYFVYVFGHLF